MKNQMEYFIHAYSFKGAINSQFPKLSWEIPPTSQRLVIELRAW